MPLLGQVVWCPGPASCGQVEGEAAGLQVSPAQQSAILAVVVAGIRQGGEHAGGVGGGQVQLS